MTTYRSLLSAWTLCFGGIFLLPTHSLAEDVVESPPVLLQMIRDTSVHEELRLSDSQSKQILAALRKVDGRWFRARIFPAEKRIAEINLLTQALSTKLGEFLSKDQMSRLRQLERQALGTRMVLRDDVASALGLTSAQRSTFRKAFAETDRKSAQIQKRLAEGAQQPEDGSRELNRLKSGERESLASTLTNEQKSKLGQLTGSPFDFNRVRRTYPLAPELQEAGVTWVQGGQQSLQDLKGKVVAVHFYAFQCINCKRNLPHYKAWHEDYADKDLVIIGIQTPETPSEEKLDRVAAAAEADGIEYPVMLDLKRSNWDAWSNTMWPTVYLIDKKGFIRRWWQGEMNWKGTPGEQQMRQTIEMLLAEDS